MDNHTYNLISQLTEEHRSLWRIKNEYMKDSHNCEECQKFWKKLESDKEGRIKELQELLSSHK